MDHGLNNDFLYSAKKIDVVFTDDLGKEKHGSGTGFVIRKDEQLVLFTNRHVLDLNYTDKSSKYKNFKLSKIILHCKRKDPVTGMPTIDDPLLVLDYKLKFSPIYENDVACITNLGGVNLNRSNHNEINFNIPFEFIATNQKVTSELTICDFVAFPGFPEWHDKRNKLPILRTGTIASDPRFDYSFTGNYDGECIAYEAFSFGGSSGSPVFAIRKGVSIMEGFRETMLVGINAGHLPIRGVYDSHSGISYFYKSKILLDFLS